MSTKSQYTREPWAESKEDVVLWSMSDHIWGIGSNGNPRDILPGLQKNAHEKSHPTNFWSGSSPGLRGVEEQLAQDTVQRCGLDKLLLGPPSSWVRDPLLEGPECLRNHLPRLQSVPWLRWLRPHDSCFPCPSPSCPQIGGFLLSLDAPTLSVQTKGICYFIPQDVLDSGQKTRQVCFLLSMMTSISGLIFQKFPI